MRTANLHVHGLVMLLTVLGSALLSSCASSSSSSSAAATVMTYATDLDGTPYCYGGTTTDCFDCSGFVIHCFQKAGIALPRSTSELYGIGERVVDGLRPGDLVFFNTNGRSVSHVGIYLGNDRFIHASTSRGVMTSSLSERYWQQRYLGARRLP